MKKATRICKLVVSRETIRALESVDLARAAGGDIVQTGKDICGTAVAAVVTTVTPTACPPG